jgi:hypothetical protein
LRLLVPVDASDESRWGVKYAVNRRRAADAVEVILLHVEEPAAACLLQRDHTCRELSQRHCERARMIMDEAALALEAHDIVCLGVHKRGDVALTIREMAKTMDCHELVMPEPSAGWWGLSPRGILDSVCSHPHCIAIVTVDADGQPVRTP